MHYAPFSSHALWGTYAELDFLRGLGTWHQPPLTARRTLLQRYEQSLALRVTWGYINEAQIRAAVRTMLAALDEEVA